MKSIFIAALIGAALTLVGCSSQDKPTVVTSQSAASSQIDEIKKNPNIPEEQKQAIINRLQAQSKVADAMKTISKK